MFYVFAEIFDISKLQPSFFWVGKTAGAKRRFRKVFKKQKSTVEEKKKSISLPQFLFFLSPFSPLALFGERLVSNRHLERAAGLDNRTRRSPFEPNDR